MRLYSKLPNIPDAPQMSIDGRDIMNIKETTMIIANTPGAPPENIPTANKAINVMTKVATNTIIPVHKPALNPSIQSFFIINPIITPVTTYVISADIKIGSKVTVPYDNPAKAGFCMKI